MVHVFGPVCNGQTIRKMRQALGMSQETLAINSLCGLRAIRRAEASKRLDAKTLRRIAASLGVPFRCVVDRV